MKAILWAKRPDTNLMAQVVDRPFLQHVVEQLVERGITRIELRLADPNGPAAGLLGDGTRWGIEIAHITPDTSLETGNHETVLLGELSCLPQLPKLEANAWPSLFFHDENRISRWSGWTTLPAACVPEFLRADDDWRGACRASGVQVHKVFLDAPSLCVGTPKQVLLSNNIALEGRFPGLHFDGQETSAGVWVARGVKLPASVVVQAPCYVGEESWIGEGSHLGPHAIIGRQCVVEPGTSVCRSVVCEGTYLGRNLEVNDSVVTRNTLYNVRWDTEIRIAERHVAAALLEGGLPLKWILVLTATLLTCAAALIYRAV
jgi:NDP-sugar pyrophosphorylase family protein